MAPKTVVVDWWYRGGGGVGARLPADIAADPIYAASSTELADEVRVRLEQQPGGMPEITWQQRKKQPGD